MTVDRATSPVSVAHWLRATWTGWLLGIPFTVLLAFMGEALGLGGTQVLVGAGMGAGVGLTQGRAMTACQVRAAPWFWSCVVGLAVPFLVSDIGHAIGATWKYSLPACVSLGGLLVGSSQAFLLRSRFTRVWSWVLASVVGWTLTGAMAGLADALRLSHSIRGLAGASVYLGLIALGGGALGLVTGLALVRGLRLTAG